jgi:hypothetical protein
MKVYCRVNGGWQLAAFQATAIAKGENPVSRFFGLISKHLTVQELDCRLPPLHSRFGSDA